MTINTSLTEEVHYKLGSQSIALPNEVPILTNSFLHKTTHAAGHDLRSPLFVIRSYSHLLQRTQEKERLERGFKLMEEATYRMEKTLNEFVGLIDIYTKPFPEKETVSFESAFESTRLNLINLIDSYQPAIAFNFDNIPQIHFNEKYLVEVMTCLLDNAIRHNSKKKDLQIIVTTKMIDDEIVLVVQDNGRGIESIKEQAKIKTPFYSHTDQEECLGMGLAKVQAIAETSKNSFRITSEKGKHTSCYFIFS